MSDAPDPMTVDERVADLLGRMTRQEKLAQLGSVWAFQVVGPDGIKADRLPAGTRRRHRPDHALGRQHEPGTAGGRAAPQRDPAVPRRGDSSRHPRHRARRVAPRVDGPWAPCFQQSIGAGATWDPELVEQVAGTIRERMLATGARHALAPVLDIARDPRWGRIEETYGEDPYLAAVIGGAYVRGLQGDDD